MLSWLIENIGTIAVALVLAAVVALIIIKMYKDKKKGKSSCGSGCAHCPMAGKCHTHS